MTPETRRCQNCKNPFVIEPEDFAFYEKMSVPPPTWCPECRMVRRMVFRNERLLFRRKDSASGKEIFSEFPPHVPAKAYDKDYWWSDAWDSMEYGREYDFSRPFFEQFRDLLYAVPWPSHNVTRMINSDYANHANDLENCYLCFDLAKCQNCAYIIDSFDLKECLDITGSSQDQLSYDSMGIGDCYRTFHSFSCTKCTNVWFSRNLTGCTDCFGCANLRHKQYYIFNRPYTKEQYQEELGRMFVQGSFRAKQAAEARSHEAWSRMPYKYMDGSHNENVSGDLISHSKNVHECFNVVGAENIKFCQHVFRGVYDSYDFTNWGNQCELMYEVFGSGDGCSNVKFAWDCCPADHDMAYSAKCLSSQDLFGCVGLQKKSYCIFNKQYSREDYFALREKIIRHMNEMPFTDRQGRIYRYGEFFPPEFSPFAYNETIAQDYFPLTKEAAIAKGYVWRDPEAREFQTTVDAADLPDHIEDVDDSILKEVIKCASCKKAFRLIPMELEFYRRITLPLPRLCHNCRFVERTKYRNQPKFYSRTCQCAGQKSENGIYQNQTPHFHGAAQCPNKFETSYAPDRQEIVYCEQCYQGEII